MISEEQIKSDIKKYKSELDDWCNKFNEQRKKKLRQKIEEMEEELECQKLNFPLSKLTPPKYPMCYDCWFPKNGRDREKA